MVFWASALAGAAAVFFGTAMVLARSLYAGAICLLVVVLQIAALLVLAGAPLVALLQLMVYAGAVMVLVVVTIMASPLPAERRWARLSAPWPLAAAGLAAPVSCAILVFMRSAGGGALALAPAPSVPSQALVGAALFGPMALATEAVGLLLLVSALVLVGRRK